MTLLFIQYYPPSCHFAPLKSKYYTQYHVLKYPQSVFVSQYQKEVPHLNLVNHSNKYQCLNNNQALELVQSPSAAIPAACCSHRTHETK